MEARSYVENIANRTTMRAVGAAMTRVLMVTAFIGAVLLLVLTGFHPAAIVIGGVLIVIGFLVLRDVVLVSRALREEPLDLAFEPAPSGGILSPGTVFGAAGGVALFSVVLGGVTWFGNRSDVAFTWGGVGLLVAAAIAAMGVPTLGAPARKWAVLADALRDHPELVAYLADARARFPASAPFPFEAPTDQVTIPANPTA